MRESSQIATAEPAKQPAEAASPGRMSYDYIPPDERALRYVERQVKERVEAMLDRHPDLVSFGVRNQIVARELGHEQHAYWQRRLEGRENDGYNIKPGIQIHCTTEGKDAVIEGMRRWMLEASMLERTGDLWVITLPHGYFRTYRGAEAIDFDIDRRELDGGLSDFRIPTAHIIKVQALDGHRWQNPNFTLDGIPNKPQTNI